MIDPVKRGDPPLADQQNLLIEQVNANMHPSVDGAHSASGILGQFIGVPPGGAVEPLYAKLDAQLDGGAGETATASIYRLTDAEDDWEDTGVDKTVYAPPLLASGDSLASDTWVDIEWRQNRWFVTNAACDAS